MLKLLPGGRTLRAAPGGDHDGPAPGYSRSARRSGYPCRRVSPKDASGVSPSAIARESHAVPLESHMKTVAALFAAVAIAALTLLPSTPALATGHRIKTNR